MVQNSAFSVALQPCSDSWVRHFLHRHRDRLTSLWATGMDYNRHNAESRYKYEFYLSSCSRRSFIMTFCQRTPNMDETGFAIGVLGRSKRLFSRRQYEKMVVSQARQDGWQQSARMVLLIPLASSSRQETPPSKANGWRISRHESTLFMLPHRPQDGRIIR